MTKTFKVGDKVRILDVSKIEFGSRYWKTGEVVSVVSVSSDGLPRLSRDDADFGGLILYKCEMDAIELVEETPKLTKKARIEALEKASKEQAEFNEATADDFADLFERVEALEKRLDEPTITSVNDVKLGDKIAIVGYLSEYLRANSSYEVVEISSENSNDGEKIVVPDDDGDEFVLRPEDFSKLRKVAS